MRDGLLFPIPHYLLPKEERYVPHRYENCYTQTIYNLGDRIFTNYN